MNLAFIGSHYNSKFKRTQFIFSRLLIFQRGGVSRHGSEWLSLGLLLLIWAKRNHWNSIHTNDMVEGNISRYPTVFIAHVISARLIPAFT